MKKTERMKQLKEMRRLYEEEKLSLEQVGKIFGISKQCVHIRFGRAGIPVRSRAEASAPRKKILDREILIRLCVDEKLSTKKAAELLNISAPKLIRELRRNAIPFPKPNRGTKRKYPELYSIKPGETIKMKSPQTSHPVGALHGTAKYAGIKISVRRIDDETLKVYRKK